MTTRSRGAIGRPLLVSDLDGTLLDSRKQVTPRTIAAINSFVAQGGLFTIATARMPYGFRDRLAAVDLKLPSIVMNGAALYSVDTDRFEHSFPMPRQAVRMAADLIRRAGAGAFVYAIHRGHLRIGYRRPGDLEWAQYNSAAAQKAHGPFLQLGDADWAHIGDIVYIAVVGDSDQLAEVLEGIVAVPECRALPYRNVYTDTDCLEIASIDAGKDNALRVLQDLLSADSLVVFGDNHNDIEMMAIADESYAPENAVAEAATAADELIRSNDHDGVAILIETRFLTRLTTTR